jgi:hypothetical protein
MHPVDTPDCLWSNPYLLPDFCHVSCLLFSPYRTSPPNSGHTVIIFRFPLLFLLLLPLDLIFPFCPFTSFSSTTLQFPYADSSSLSFLSIPPCSFSFICNLSLHAHFSFCLFSFFRAPDFFLFYAPTVHLLCLLLHHVFLFIYLFIYLLLVSLRTLSLTSI